MNALDFARRSNVGILIAAFMVGVLAFAANKYAQLLPRIVEYFNATELVQEDPSPSDTETQPAATVPTLDDYRTKLQTAGNALAGAYQQWQVDRQPVPSDLIGQQLLDIQQSIEAIISDESVVPDERIEIERQHLHVQFMAAEMAPDDFSSSFLEATDRFIAEHSDTEAPRVAVLRCFHLYRQGKPEEARVFQHLSEFADRYPGDQYTVTFFSLVSEDLYVKGHHSLAQKVLREGIQRFKGHPGRSRLVNQLVDQQQMRR